MLFKAGEEVKITSTTVTDNYISASKVASEVNNIKAANSLFTTAIGRYTANSTGKVALNLPKDGIDAESYYFSTVPLSVTNYDVDQKLDAYHTEDVNDLNNLYNVDNNNLFNGIVCRGTKRGGNLEWPGNRIHKILQFYYKELNKYALSEYIIPGAGVKINPRTLKKYAGYADIVNPPTGEMFEIKEDKYELEGKDELNNYINLANSSLGCRPASQENGCVPCLWRGGRSFIPPPPFPDVFTGKVVTVTMSADYEGVLLYKSEDKGNIPDYVLQSLPKSIKDAINEVTSRVVNKRQLQPSLSLFDAVKSSCKSNSNCTYPPLDVQEILQYMDAANTATKTVRLALLVNEVMSGAAIALSEAEAVEVVMLLCCLL